MWSVGWMKWEIKPVQAKACHWHNKVVMASTVLAALKIFVTVAMHV